MSRGFELAEEARAAGRTDLELVLLWNALEEARASDDRATLDRVRVRASELQRRGFEEAHALVEGAEATLADIPGAERLGSLEVEEQPRGTWRTRLAPIAVIVGLALFVVVQFGARVVFDRLTSDRSRPFERPPVQVVPTGRGHANAQRIVTDGLHLLPADRTAARLLDRIARATQLRYGVPTTVLRRMRSEVPTLDGDRHQLDGIAVIKQIRRSSPVWTSRAVVIAVTHADLFSSEAPGDRFSFGVRANAGYAVISTARLDPRNYGQAADPALLERRLEKMILRYLGELYFGLPRNGNEKSLLRAAIRSLDDVDEMTRDFCPERPGAIASC